MAPRPYGSLILPGIMLVSATAYYMYLFGSNEKMTDEEAMKKYSITKSQLEDQKKKTQLLTEKLKEAAGMKDR